jgi:uncharacterized sulfatase
MTKNKIVLLVAAMGMSVVCGATDERPNILFFAFDDLRPLVGAYGEPDPITPNLDALAEVMLVLNRERLKEDHVKI